MAYRWSADLKDRDVTEEHLFMNRRNVLAGLSGVGVSAPAAGPAFSISLQPNAWQDITEYNNYYEFGTGKEDPARYAKALTTKPWSVEIGGLVDRPGSYAFEDILNKMKIEERIYRIRCVEAWSMVIPWVGIPLADIIKSFKPLSSATHVRFETLHDRERMPGQKSRVICLLRSWILRPYPILP